MDKLYVLSSDFKDSDRNSSENEPVSRKSIRISPHLRTKEAYDCFIWRIRIAEGYREHQLPPLYVINGGRR